MSKRLRTARSIALDISPLRESRAYRALWFGQMVSLMGSNMRVVAVAYQIFQITGSTVAVGMVGLVEIVPLILFSLFGGALADRLDRRKVLFASQLGLITTITTLTLLSLSEQPPLFGIYLLVGVAAALTAVDQPARSAIAPMLIRPDLISAAMALRQVVFQTTQIVGPLIGGVVIAASGGRVAWVYGIDAFTFLASLSALRWVPPVPPAITDPQTAWGSVREGLHFALENRVILGIFVIDLVAMILGMPRAVFPALAQETFDVGAKGLGMLFAAPALGALAGALTSGWVKRVRGQGRAVIGAVTVWGGAITLAGLTVFSFPLTLAFLAIAGAADVISAVFRNTMLLESTPDILRGRATAVNIMVVTGGPRVGDIEAGLVAGAFGAPASVVIGGVGCLIGTAIVASSIPALRNYTRR